MADNDSVNSKAAGAATGKAGGQRLRDKDYVANSVSSDSSDNVKIKFDSGLGVPKGKVVTESHGNSPTGVNRKK
jgi:hypothetical protein